MDETRMNTTQYLNHFWSSDASSMSLLTKAFTDRGRYEDTQNVVATTLLISFRRIYRDYKLAAEYLQFKSLLADKEVPGSLLLARKL